MKFCSRNTNFILKHSDDIFAGIGAGFPSYLNCRLTNKFHTKCPKNGYTVKYFFLTSNCSISISISIALLWLVTVRTFIQLFMVVK